MATFVSFLTNGYVVAHFWLSGYILELSDTLKNFIKIGARKCLFLNSIRGTLLATYHFLKQMIK